MSLSYRLCIRINSYGYFSVVLQTSDFLLCTFNILLVRDELELLTSSLAI